VRLSIRVSRSAMSRSAPASASASALPLVLVDREIEDAPVACVRVDDAAGVGLVVQHLTELGTGRAAFVSAGLEISSARARHDAFYELTARAGIEVDPPLLGDFSASWGAEAATRLAADRAVDAVFCANDEIALGLLTAFRAQHVKVPEDVAVIGFDDTPAASLCVPSLTTVQQPTEAIARRAIEALGADPPMTGTRTLEPRLVVRGSTTADAAAIGTSATR
jgi:LacI family transcriptional regulator